MAVYKNQSGAWKESSNISVKQTGVWKDVTQMFVRNVGIWKPLLSNDKHLGSFYHTNTGLSLRPIAITKDNSGNNYVLYSSSGAIIVKFSKDWDVLIAKQIAVSASVYASTGTYMPAIDAVAFVYDKYVIFVHASTLLSYNTANTVVQFPDIVVAMCDDPRYNNRVFVANSFMAGSYYSGYAQAKVYSADLVNFASGYYGNFSFYVGTTYAVDPYTWIQSNLVFDSTASKLYCGGSARNNDYVSSNISFSACYNVSGYDIISANYFRTFYYYQSFDQCVYYISDNAFSGTTDRVVSGNFSYYEGGYVSRYGIYKINSTGVPSVLKVITGFSDHGERTRCVIDSNNNAILIIWDPSFNDVYFIKFDSNLNYISSIKMRSNYGISFYGFSFNNDIMTFAGYRASSSLYYRSFFIEVPTDFSVPIGTVLNYNDTYNVTFSTYTPTITSFSLSYKTVHGSHASLSGLSNVTGTISTFTQYTKTVNTYE